MSVRPRRIVLVAFDGVEALDVTGPASVFARVNYRNPDACEIVFASARGGSVRSQCGLTLGDTVPLASIREPVDTILVAGGSETALREAVFAQGVASWLAEAARSARRVGACAWARSSLGRHDSSMVAERQPTGLLAIASVRIFPKRASRRTRSS